MLWVGGESFVLSVADIGLKFCLSIVAAACCRVDGNRIQSALRDEMRAKRKASALNEEAAGERLRERGKEIEAVLSGLRSCQKRPV